MFIKIRVTDFNELALSILVLFWQAPNFNLNLYKWMGLSSLYECICSKCCLWYFTTVYVCKSSDAGYLIEQGQKQHRNNWRSLLREKNLLQGCLPVTCLLQLFLWRINRWTNELLLNNSADLFELTWMQVWFLFSSVCETCLQLWHDTTI